METAAASGFLMLLFLAQSAIGQPAPPGQTGKPQWGSTVGPPPSKPGSPPPPPPPGGTMGSSTVVPVQIIECPATIKTAFDLRFDIQEPTPFDSTAGFTMSPLAYFLKAEVMGDSLICTYGMPVVLLSGKYADGEMAHAYYGRKKVPAGKTCGVANENNRRFVCK
ncbi:MAG TPA: hypothetical protein VEU32_17115 [Burkholderiales bacterium]|nr:hypothetical protein [Burkholderiales bacterium]